MKPRARVLVALVAMAAGVVDAASAWAAPITILDPGFDVFVTGTTTPIGDNRFSGNAGGPVTAGQLSNASTGAPLNEFGDHPAGWALTTSNTGRFRNDVETLIDTGTRAIFTSPDPTIVFQNLGIPVAPNTIYTATIELGDRDSSPLTGGTDVTKQSASPALQLVADVGGAGETDLGGILTFVPPPNGGTSLMTLIVTTGAVVPAGNLFIVASTNGPDDDPNIGNTHTLFDNATLDATIIPEPTSLSLLGLGGLWFATITRRKRK